ncbi:MAG: PP2C family protein-serine/threonine phosphatase, partial [Pyrinomonadaceae bacterium]
YDDRTRTLRYTNAGHNTPLLVRGDGSVERLTAGGTLIGAFEWAKYEEGTATLAADDMLVIFSDGLTEAQNATGEEYGDERLTQLVAAGRSASADETRRAVFDEIDRWSGAQERGDDQTLVIVKSRRQ